MEGLSQQATVLETERGGEVGVNNYEEFFIHCLREDITQTHSCLKV